jgi:glycosyltransferase involved in cell wall biosynthesis
MDSLKVGGVQSFALQLGKCFDDPRFILSFAALHGEGLDPRFSEMRPKPLAAGARRLDPALLFRLRGIIRSGDYDIVHAHDTPSSFLCERFRKFFGIRRLIVHIHHLYRRQDNQRLQNLVEIAAYRNADLILGCSQHILNKLPRSIPKEMLPYGLDTDKFKPQDERVRAAARAEFGFAPANVVLGFVGRLIQCKEPWLLLQAMSRLTGEFPELRALIVGAGPEEASLRSLAERLRIQERIVFAGYRTDVSNCLAAMDIFAMLSHEVEGFGLALAEAMAMGKPCVTSDYPAARELIKPGEDVLTFPSGDATALAECVRKFARDSDSRAEFGAAARRAIVERFEARQCARHLAEIYARLL